MSQALLNDITSELTNARKSWGNHRHISVFAVSALFNALKETKAYYELVTQQGKRYDYIESKLEIDWSETEKLMHRIGLKKMANLCKSAPVSLAKSKDLEKEFKRDCGLDFSNVIDTARNTLSSVRNRINPLDKK